MRKFYLFAFSDGVTTVITRGENQEQAMSYACRNNGAFKKGVTVFPVDHLPLNAAKLYSCNHAVGWLNRAPIWLQKLEREQAVSMGSENIIKNLFTKLPLLMYKENQYESTSC
jgi:hypothetical protein